MALGFGVWVLGFGFWGLGLGFRVAMGFRVEGPGLGSRCLRFGVWVLGFGFRA